MHLVDKRIIKPANSMYAELDNLCFLSKNLYNSTLYAARQSFFAKHYKNYNKINKEFTDANQPDYRALPAKVSKQTQMLVDKNFKSFFALSKTYRKGGLENRPKLPKYLDSCDGRQVVVYPKDALSFAREGYIRLSKTNIYIKNFVDKKDVKRVVVVPRRGYIAIHILYDKPCKEPVDNNKYAAIDLGVDNLATITSTEFSPIIVNGKPVKSINRFYNKLIGQHKSLIALSGHKKSQEINNLWRRRMCKIDDYLFNAAHYIVNQLVNHQVGHLIVGYNKKWKQDTKMGKRNNQKFVYIPFERFVHILQYKCALEGIEVAIQEESYTSQASFLDNDDIPVYGDALGKKAFSGRRIKRGLYKSGCGTVINADMNGSLNILKKYLVKINKWNGIIRDVLLHSRHNIVRVTV